MVRIVSNRCTTRARYHLNMTFCCCRITIARNYIVLIADSESVPEQRAPAFCCRRLDNVRHQFDLPGP